jgi:hypothetical protein
VDRAPVRETRDRRAVGAARVLRARGAPISTGETKSAAMGQAP